MSRGPTRAGSPHAAQRSARRARTDRDQRRRAHQPKRADRRADTRRPRVRYGNRQSSTDLPTRNRPKRVCGRAGQRAFPGYAPVSPRAASTHGASCPTDRPNAQQLTANHRNAEACDQRNGFKLRALQAARVWVDRGRPQRPTPLSARPDTLVQAAREAGERTTRKELRSARPCRRSSPTARSPEH